VKEVIAEEQQIAEERLRAEARPEVAVLRRHIRDLPMLQPAVTLDGASDRARRHYRDATEQTSCVLIIDQRQLVGVFTERDVVTTVAAQEIDLDRLPVRVACGLSLIAWRWTMNLSMPCTT